MVSGWSGTEQTLGGKAKHDGKSKKCSNRVMCKRTKCGDRRVIGMTVLSSLRMRGECQCMPIHRLFIVVFVL
jgi:hypothetical protein